MQLDAVFVAVTDPEHVILLRRQPRQGDYDLGLLRLVRGIFNGEADHSPLVRTGIDQRFGAGWIAAQHLRQGFTDKGWPAASRIRSRLAS